MKVFNDIKLHSSPELIIKRYFSYAEFTYDDGSGERDATIGEVVGDLFDDDAFYLAQVIVAERDDMYEIFYNMIPEYYKLVRLY